MSEKDLQTTTLNNASDDSVDDVEYGTADRRFMLRLDLRLVPILGLTYMILFLDRTNIANARIEGLEKSLHMPSNGYNTCLWVFYIPFVLFEVPSNLLMSMPKVKPNYYLGACMLVLGVISTCQGLAKSYHGLVAVRFFMGIFEAVLPSGAALMIGSYYTRKEAAIRFAWFFAFAEAGPCFSGLLAYAIRNMNGTNGFEGWRWIFILEGIITIVISFFVVLIVPDFPQKAKFLSDIERAKLVAKLSADRGNEKLDLKSIKWAPIVLDYKIWMPTLLFFCCDMTAASMSSFIPTILTELGWTSARAQVMSIPIWLTGMAVQLVGSWTSSKLGVRFPFIIGGLCLALIGWVIQVVYVRDAAIRYFALFCMSGGTFIQMALLAGWMTNNLRGRASMAIGTAIQLGLGNCANFVASNVFITKQKPRYPSGFRTGLAITVVGIVACFVHAGLLRSHNQKLERKREGTGEGEDTQTEYKYVL